MNTLELYKFNNLIKSYDLRKCNLPKNLRDYLMTDLSEFSREYYELVGLLSENLDLMVGEYVASGAPLIPSNDAPITDQIPVINHDGTYIITFSFSGDLYDKVKINLDGEVVESALPKSTSSKKYIQYFLSADKELNVINIFNNLDKQSMGFKTKLTNNLFSNISTEESNKLPKGLYEDGKYGIYKVASMEEVEFDAEEIFNSLYTTKTYKS